jgi:hypothetical protein
VIAILPARHSLLDDAQGLVTGTLFVALALSLLAEAVPRWAAVC